MSAAYQAEQILLALQAAQEAARQQAGAPRPPLGWFRIFVGVVFLAMLAVGLIVNATVLGHFGWHQGQSDLERWALAAAGVLAVVLCAMLHPAAVMTWRPGHFVLDHRGQPKWRRGRPSYGLLTALSCLAVVSLALNFAGGIGVMSTARKQTEIKAADAVDEGRRLRDRHAEMKSALDSISKHRPAETVAAEIQAHRLHRFWKATQQCAEDSVLSRAQRDYCRDYAKLQSEQRSAEQATKLRAELASLDTQLASPLRAELAAGSAQVDAIARNTGMSPDMVQARISLLFPLLLELMIVTFGWLAMVAFRVDHRAIQDIPHGAYAERPQPPSRQLPPPSSPPEPQPLRVVETGPPPSQPDLPKMFSRDVEISDDPLRQRAVLTEFWNTKVRRMNGSQIAEPSIYHHYQAFAIARGVQEYDMPTFRRLSANQAPMSEINDLYWYYGVSLA